MLVTHEKWSLQAYIFQGLGDRPFGPTRPATG